MENTLVAALLAGKWAVALQASLTMIALAFTGQILAKIAQGAITWLQAHRQAVHDWKQGRIAFLTDRLFDLSIQALSNTDGLEQAIVTSASKAEGLTQADLNPIGQAALQNLLSNVNAHDLSDLGWLLLGRSNAAPRDIHAAIEKRFKTNLPELAVQALNKQRGTRGLLQPAVVERGVQPVAAGVLVGNS
jgi:hypothetical protein